MRILLWHGWLLEGSGSNVYTARTAEAFRAAGHDVVLLCQETDRDRFPFVDAWGTVGPEGVRPEDPGTSGGSVPQAPGRLLLLRPGIAVLPVFVVDEYPGFEVKRFVDLTDAELQEYLDRGAAALAAAAEWHRPDAVVTGHAVPGAPVARRALGAGRYVAKVHGSDLEYAARRQPRLAQLARWGLEGAVTVVGASRDVLARAEEVAPAIIGRTRVVAPGVDVERFVPRPRRQALEQAAALLERDPHLRSGRSSNIDDAVRDALARRDRGALLDLALAYDQNAPDREAPDRLRALAGFVGPLVGYLGKLIPEKGPELLIQALAICADQIRALVVGFGQGRELVTALVHALDDGDPEAARWLGSHTALHIVLADQDVRRAAGSGARLSFTGRLDHRYAPFALAAMDVLVVPSVLDEAFGMVAAEAAAVGTLPLVARHSGLAEVAGRLEEAVGRPGLFSFEPGETAPIRLADALRTLLQVPVGERRELRASLASVVRTEWTWSRTAQALLDASRG